MSIAKDTNGQAIKVGDVVSFRQGEAPKRGYGKVIDIIGSRLGFSVLVVEGPRYIDAPRGDDLGTKGATVEVFALDCTFAGTYWI